MIERYAAGGIRNFAISSSGNAALSAQRYIAVYNKEYSEQPINLKIFVGQNVDGQKLASLNTEANKFVSIVQCERPMQEVHKLNKSGEAKALRQSKDELALVGYKELAEELSELKPGSIFIPTSSGTTAQALGSSTPKLGKIHIVQTTKVYTIAGDYDTDFTKSETSLAGAIVDIVGERKQAVLDVVKKSHGSGWVVSDEEIRDAINLVRAHLSLELSPNSALSVAGLNKAISQGKQFNTPVVCLITGQ